MADEEVKNEDIEKIEQEIKQKEEAKAKSDAEAKEKEIREQIAKEQEMLDMKKKLQEIEEEKKKMESLVLEQKKQHEEEVKTLNSQIGQSKQIISQSPSPNVPSAPSFTEEDLTDINKGSQEAWEKFLDKTNKYRG